MVALSSGGLGLKLVRVTSGVVLEELKLVFVVVIPD